MKFCFIKKDFIETSIDPKKTAIIGEDETITWQEFKTRSDDFCRQFETIGFANSFAPVLVYGHKSVNMIVAFYSLMRLNIPYIPADIIYPLERIQKIVNISKTTVIINTTQNSLGLEGCNELFFQKDSFQLNSQHPIALNSHKLPDPLIYIIFTSGSTGEPKGVQISTEAMLSFTHWMVNDFGFTVNDIFINTAILSFDLSVFEVMTFGALGATLLLNSKEQSQHAPQFIERVSKYKGTVWVSTPSFAMIYSRMTDTNPLNAVNTFLFCGEVLPHATAKNLKNNFPFARVINTYGPTEATVASTIIEITDNILNTYNPLPVGYSKSTSWLEIENGEIIIIGENVSRGYLNNDALNAQKFFIKNGQRAFRTGDFGYLENDILFFNGRNDDLIKLNGFRIELNEISEALNSLPYILQGETIALKRDGIAKKIVSIIQFKSNVNTDFDAIRTDLLKTLPHYMIPSDFKVVNSIPLNANGKADKKLLEALYLNSNEK
jgi:D-alanine--poly(phosphoribitol) ligase subunit 1